MENNEQKSPEELSLHELLQRIYNGTFDPKNLPTPIRQALVQVLILKGQEHIAIARLLKVSDRTIRRDVQKIWRDNAMKRDPELTNELVGEVRVRAMTLAASLTKMGHSSDGKFKERSQALFMTWRLLEGLLGNLYKLGYLLLEDPSVTDTNEESTQAGKETLREDSSLKRTQLSEEDLRLMKIMKSGPPQEREKIRRDLIKRAEKNSGIADFLEKLDLPAVEKLMRKPDKSDEDPGAAGVLAAT